MSSDKIGLYGGTFDPVHNGHILIADTARKQLSLTKVIFLPTASPPHKLQKPMTDAHHRHKMVSLAIRQYPAFGISDYEQKKSPAYTIDTIRYFKKKYSLSEKELFLIIGADNLHDIESWKDPEAIFNNCTVVTAPRYNQGLPQNRFTPQVVPLSLDLIPISSTMIREKIKNRQKIKDFVHTAVEEYIITQNLYR